MKKLSSIAIWSLIISNGILVQAGNNRNKRRNRTGNQEDDAGLVISGDVAHKIWTAAILTDLLYSHSEHDDPVHLNNSFESIQYLQEDNGVSAWYIAKQDNVCYGIIRGTDPDNLRDIGQNLNVLDLTIDYGYGTPQCHVHRGFYENFVGSDGSFVVALDECLTSCSNVRNNNKNQNRNRNRNNQRQNKTKKRKQQDHCELVLAGHSQGGASAAIGSLLYGQDGTAYVQRRDGRGGDFFFDNQILNNRMAIDPIVISFGAPRAMKDACGASINSKNHYRFVNMAESGIFGDNLPTADIVPMLPMLGAVHYGHALYWNTEGNDMVYLGLDGDKNFAAVGVPAHASDLYRQRAEQSFSSASNNSIEQSNGNGNKRKQNRKKKEKAAKLNDIIVPTGLEIGSSCLSDAHCFSGRCDGTCKGKRQSCETCNEDTDCTSGKCVLRSARFVCANNDGLMDDDCYCDWSSQCSSGRCEGFFPFECKPKLEKGKRCNEHNDCLSNQCSWSWKCI